MKEENVPKKDLLRQNAKKAFGSNNYKLEKTLGYCVEKLVGDGIFLVTDSKMRDNKRSLKGQKLWYCTNRSALNIELEGSSK